MLVVFCSRLSLSHVANTLPYLSASLSSYSPGVCGLRVLLLFLKFVLDNVFLQEFRGIYTENARCCNVELFKMNYIVMFIRLDL